jgi:hypothetical protein
MSMYKACMDRDSDVAATATVQAKHAALWVGTVTAIAITQDSGEVWARGPVLIPSLLMSFLSGKEPTKRWNELVEKLTLEDGPECMILFGTSM